MRRWWGPAAPGLGILAGLLVLLVAALATVVALPPLDPDTMRVYVTRRDWEDLAIYTAQVHDWMMSVEQCLARVAPSVTP